MTATNRRIVLKRRPVGMPTPDDFAFEDVPVPAPAEGEVVLKHLYLSLDPYQRGRLSDARSYAAPVPIGGVVECRTVGRVLASRDARFAPGDTVLGGFGWQTHSVMPGKQLLKLDPAEAPISTALGVLGAWPVKILLLLGVFAFFYHLCNGIRHLWWDSGRGFEIPQVYRSGWIMLGAAVTLSLVAWGLLLSGGGA